MRRRWASVAMAGMLAACTPAYRPDGTDPDQLRMTDSAAAYRKCILDTPVTEMRTAAAPRMVVSTSQSRCRNAFQIMTIAADTYFATQESSDEARWAHGRALRYVEAREAEAAEELTRRVTAARTSNPSP